jgi:rod shape-determining protein MreC
MRSLYKFIIETIHIFLFLILGGISIYLIYKSSHYKQWALNTFTKEITGPVLKFQSKYVDWLYVRRENDLLTEQNRSLLSRTYNHQLEPAILDSVYHKDSVLFTYRTAKVIESTINRQDNYIILDKGSNDGIEVDMGVISAQGVVGIIKMASPNFSIAIPVVHSQFTIFAKVKNSDAVGMLTWDGANARYAQLANLPHIEDVNVSDTIVTQHSLIFPPDYPVGVVESVLPETVGGYFVIEVRLLVSFEQLRNTYIIGRKEAKEVNELMINANIQ